MLSSEEDVEAHALHKQGWTISAIARHLDRDRKTVRGYLNGDRRPGVRRTGEPDPFDAIAGYVGQRLADDPHVLATALFDEVVALGYPRAYPTFTRQLRARGLRPVCPACSASGPGVPTIEIEHPAGQEAQWDWVELPGAPWLDGGTANLLVGALAYSSKTRGVFCESQEQPHLFDGIDRTAARLGGVTRRWRFDRMSTVVHIGSGRVLDSFAAFAKHHGVAVDICPAYRAKRKGVVEKGIDFIARRWWRTADVATLEEAQRSLDRFCEMIGDARPRHDLDGRPATVASLADHERLRGLPATRFPATLEVMRTVAASALVSFRGNHYSVDPSLVGAEVVVRVATGASTIDIVDPVAGVLARHRLVAPGQGAIVRGGDHAVALEAAVLSSFTSGRPCRRKANRPPSPAAKALAARVVDDQPAADAVVIDLAAWADLVPEGGR